MFHKEVAVEQIFLLHIADTVQPGVELNGFADDHSIRKDFKANDRHAESEATGSLEASMESISKWMSSMRLKLSGDKNQYIMFGYRDQLKKCF